MKNLLMYIFVLLMPVQHAFGFGQIRSKVDSFSDALGSGDAIYTAKAAGKLVNGLQNYEWQYGGSILNLHVNPSTSSPSFNLKITFSVATTTVTNAPVGNGKKIYTKVGPSKSVTFNSLEEILNNSNVPNEIKDEVRKTHLPRLKQFNSQLLSISNEVKERVKSKKSRVRNFNELKEFETDFRSKVNVPLDQLIKGVPNVSIVMD